MDADMMRQSISVGGPAVAGMVVMGVFAGLLMRWCLTALKERAAQDAERDRALVDAISGNTRAVQESAEAGMAASHKIALELAGLKEAVRDR